MGNCKINSLVRWFLSQCDGILGSWINLFKVCLLTWQLCQTQLVVDWQMVTGAVWRPSSHWLRKAPGRDQPEAVLADHPLLVFRGTYGQLLRVHVHSHREDHGTGWTCLRLVLVFPKMCSASLDRLIGFKGSSRTLVLGKLLVKAKWNPLFRHYLEPKMCNRHMAISGRGMEVFCTFPFNFGTITLVFVGWLAGWLVECSHGKGVLRKTGGNWFNLLLLFDPYHTNDCPASPWLFHSIHHLQAKDPGICTEQADSESSCDCTFSRRSLQCGGLIKRTNLPGNVLDFNPSCLLSAV